MKHNKKLRIISILLMVTVVLEFTFSNSIVMATESASVDKVQTTAETFNEEDVLEKGEDYTIFENEDGTRTLKMYTSAVRTENEDGKLTDIDNSIVEKKTEDEEIFYENVNGFVDVILPGNIIENPINVKTEESEVSFLPVFAETVEEGDGNGVPKIETVDTLYNEKTEKETGITYSTPDENVELEYFPIDDGVKENIILHEKPKSNVFSYKIICKGQIPELENGGVIFRDQDSGKERGAILAPFMIDSSDTPNKGYSEELRYSLEEIDKDKGLYLLNLSVSEEYLNNEERVYPITIDPTYTANSSTDIKDVYIMSGSDYKDTNYYSSTIRQMIIGYSPTNKTCRTLIKFPNLQNKIAGNYVNSATLKIYENYNTSPYPTIAAYRITESWTLGDVTWSNQPSRAAEACDTSKCTGGTAAHTLTFPVVARKWAKGTSKNYGLMLKATTESSSSNNFASFFGARSTESSKRPVLTVNYTVPNPSKPSTASSVEVSDTYIKKGESIKVSWTGISSNILSEIQAKIVKFTSENTYSSATVVQSFTGIDSTASTGSYTLNSTKTTELGEGKFAISIRGIDKVDNAGTGKYKCFWIDSSKPKAPSKISLSSAREASDKETAKVTIDFTPGTDMPELHPSGIKEHTVKLYNADNDTLLDSKTISGKSVTFKGIDSGLTVYAKISSTDNAGNISTAGVSSDHKISNLILPSLDESDSFICSLEDNPWLSKDNMTNKISWNVDYEGNLGKITAAIQHTDGTDISTAFDEEEILSVYDVPPLEYKNYSLGQAFALKNLPDGKYKVVFKFYASDNNGYTQKEFDLCIDNVAPIINTDTMTPSENEVLKKMAIISFSSSDSDSGIWTSRVQLINEKGVCSLLTESGGVYNLNTTDFDDGNYTIRFTVNDKAGNRTIYNRNVIISNPPPTPLFEIVNAYGQNEDNAQIYWSYLDGDLSKNKVSKLQYYLSTEATENIGEELWNDISTDDPAADGFGEIKTQDLADGKYQVYFRAIDSDGVAGVVRKAYYTIDTTAPWVNLSSPIDNSSFINTVTLKGSIEDENLKNYKIYYALGETTDTSKFEEIYSFENSNDLSKKEGNLAILDFSNNNKYPENYLYTIKIVVNDKSGNDAIKYITVEKRGHIEIPSEFDIEKNTIPLVVNSDDMQFSLINKDKTPYSANSLKWFINGQKVNSIANGTIDFSDKDIYPDNSEHTLLVYDKKSDGTISYGVSTYETVLFNSDEKETPTMTENVIVGTGQIEIDGGELSGNCIFSKNTSSTIPNDIVEIKLDVNENIPDGTTIEYFLQIGDSEYQEIIPNQYYSIAEPPFSQTVLNDININVKFVLQGRRADVPEVLDWNLTAKASRGETFIVDTMDKNNPINVTAVPQLNYKTKISWEKRQDCDENITYEIYRSTSPNFEDNNTICIQEGVTDTYWYDNYIYIDEGENKNNSSTFSVDFDDIHFYYKVKAVKSFDGSVRKSIGAQSNAVHFPAMNEYTKRLGLKDYWGYFDFIIGCGAGHIEQSKGNFSYTETDAEVIGKEIDLSMERTYNSMSNAKSALGYGWDFSFNPILLDAYDGYSDNIGLLFKDGSGTIYTFLSIKDSSAIKEFKKDGTELTEKIETHYKSPLGVYIHLKKIETLDIDDKDKDGNKTEIVETEFQAETTNGDVYTFNHNSQISSYKDANDNEINYSYDETGRLIEIENRNGATEESVKAKPDEKRSRITLNYVYKDSEGREIKGDLIRSVHLPNGQSIKYIYNENDVLIEVQLYAAGVNVDEEEPYLTTKYGYEGNSSLLSSITDPKGNENLITYYSSEDKEDRCESVIYSNGDAKKYLYNKAEGNAASLDFDETIEEVYLNDTNMLSRLFTGKNKIGESCVRYNVDGNIIYSKDIEGSIINSEYVLGLETSSSGTAESYAIGNDGYISHSTETVTTITRYDEIPNNNTLASKIASTKGNITEEVDISGNLTTYEYKANGSANQENITQMTISEEDGGAATESYTYDENGNLLSMIDEDTGETVEFTYNQSGQVLTETSKNNDVITSQTTYIYDENGNLISETDNGNGENGATTCYQYDNYGRVVMERDSRGYVTEFVYDDLDRVVETIFYLNACDSFHSLDKDSFVKEERAYDKNGNLVSETDREGRVTSYIYDNMDRVISKTIRYKGEEKTWTYSYSVTAVNVFFPSGTIGYEYAYLETCTNPDGDITSEIYKDKSGRAVKIIEEGNVTSFRYNSDGEIVEMFTIGEVDDQAASVNRGQTILANYDKYGNNTANIINPVWDAEKSQYFIGDDTIVYSYVYDSLGRLIKEINPNNHETEFEYDTNSQITRVTLPNTLGEGKPNVTKNIYGIVDETSGEVLTRTINAEGFISDTVENSSGQVTKITDHGKDIDDKKIETTFKYDSLGNMIEESDASGTKYYQYDDVNNLIKMITKKDSDGNEIDYITYTYDYSGAMSSRKEYEDRQLKRVALYQYDSMKRLVNFYEGEEPEKNSNGEYINIDWVSYTYDIEDNLTSISYPSETDIEKVNYQYGEYKRLEKISAKDKGNERLIREYEYFNDGRVKLVKDYRTNSAYILKEYQYDAVGRCISILITDSESNNTNKEECFLYTYDKCSNIVTEEIKNNNIVNNNDAESNLIGEDGTYHIKRYYTYNALNQLADVQEYSVSENNCEVLENSIQYTYDRIGNIISQTTNGVTENYIYDEDGLNFLTEINVSGDSTGSKRKLFTYDDVGNLIKVEDEEKDIVTENTYDVNGYLLTTTVTKGQGDDAEITITENTYNGEGTRLSKKVNDITTHYYVVNDVILFTYIRNANGDIIITTENVPTIDGSVIFTKRQDDKYYIYNADLRGSTSAIVSETGEYLQSYLYDIYGEPEICGETNFDNEFMFTGSIYDQSTGLFYLSSRYYDATTGRFTTIDSNRGSLNNPLSMNLYSYCENNPIRYTDQEGDFPAIIVAAGAGAAINGAYSLGFELMNYALTGDQIDWKNVVLDTASGAVDGAMLTMGLGPIVELGVDISMNIVEQKITNEKLDFGEAVLDGVIDSTIGETTDGVLDMVSKTKKKTENEFARAVKKVEKARNENKRYEKKIKSGKKKEKKKTKNTSRKKMKNSKKGKSRKKGQVYAKGKRDKKWLKNKTREPYNTVERYVARQAVKNKVIEAVKKIKPIKKKINSVKKKICSAWKGFKKKIKFWR